MLRCRDLERKNTLRSRGSAGIAREGLLAAAAIQMEPGDMLCGEAGDTTIEELFLPQTSVSKKKPTAKSPALPVLSQLTLCVGMARGLQASGSKGVVLALTSAGATDPEWQDAMAYAQAARLPIVFLCLDTTGGKISKRAAKPPLTWLVAQKFAKSVHLPTLAVDGEDAVAVYRVVQESLLRARSGDGPALAWCVLTKGSGKGRSRPIAGMEKYLAVRGLKPNLRAV